MGNEIVWVGQPVALDIRPAGRRGVWPPVISLGEIVVEAAGTAIRWVRGDRERRLVQVPVRGARDPMPLDRGDVDGERRMCVLGGARESGCGQAAESGQIKGAALRESVLQSASADCCNEADFDTGASDELDVCLLPRAHGMNPRDRSRTHPLSRAQGSAAARQVPSQESQGFERPSRQARGAGIANLVAIDDRATTDFGWIIEQGAIQAGTDNEAAVVTEVGNDHGRAEIVDGRERTGRELHSKMPLPHQRRRLLQGPCRFPRRRVTTYRSDQLNFDRGKAAWNRWQRHANVRFSADDTTRKNRTGETRYVQRRLLRERNQSDLPPCDLIRP